MSWGDAVAAMIATGSCRIDKLPMPGKPYVVPGELGCTYYELPDTSLEVIKRIGLYSFWKSCYRFYTKSHIKALLNRGLIDQTPQDPERFYLNLRVLSESLKDEEFLKSLNKSAKTYSVFMDYLVGERLEKLIDNKNNPQVIADHFVVNKRELNVFSY